MHQGEANSVLQARKNTMDTVHNDFPDDFDERLDAIFLGLAQNKQETKQVELHLE